MAVALVFTIGGGVAAYFLIRQYEGSNVQTYFETATYLLAAVILTYMTFWMQFHARVWPRSSSVAAISHCQRVGGGDWDCSPSRPSDVRVSRRWSSRWRSSSPATDQAATPVHGKLLLIGAVLGLAVALCVAFAIFKLGVKLNMRGFFRVLGIALMVFAAGLLADAIENMQQLHWLNFGSHVLWNTSGTVSEASSFGDVLHSLLGYADRPTELQAFVWLLYVVVSTILFIRVGRRGHHRRSHETAHAKPSALDGRLTPSPKPES